MNFEDWFDKRFQVCVTPAQKAILKEAFQAGQRQGFSEGYKDGVEITTQEYQLLV